MEIIKVEERLMPIYKVSDEFKEHKHESCDYWHPKIRVHPNRNDKLIIIRTKKVVTKNGIKSREILGIENVLGNNKLPKEYISYLQYFFIKKDPERDNSLVFNYVNFKCNFGRNYIYKGDIIEEKDFQYMLEYIKKAGKRLSEINKRIAKDRKEWNGEEVFTI